MRNFKQFLPVGVFVITLLVSGVSLVVSQQIARQKTTAPVPAQAAMLPGGGCPALKGCGNDPDRLTIPDISNPACANIPYYYTWGCSNGGTTCGWWPPNENPDPSMNDCNVPTPACGTTCRGDLDCVGTASQCVGGVCRNPVCPTESSCTCTTGTPTPSPTATPTPSETPVVTPTPSGTPTATPTPSETPVVTPTPSATPGPGCNSSCSTQSDCPSGMQCVGGNCRNNLCQDRTDCVCPTPAVGCNSTCTSSSQCPSGLTCDTGGHCRNAGCTSEPDCSCHQPQPTPTPKPTTPPAGNLLPTWGTFGAAAAAMIGGLLLLGL